jgi:hypothetical protein
MLDQPAGLLRKCTRLLSIRRSQSVDLMTRVGRPIDHSNPHRHILNWNVIIKSLSRTRVWIIDQPHAARRTHLRYVRAGYYQRYRVSQLALQPLRNLFPRPLCPATGHKFAKRHDASSRKGDRLMYIVMLEHLINDPSFTRR